MNDRPSPTPNDASDTVSASTPQHFAAGSRRRFLKGGAAATPVILTFTSRPVLGFEQACMSPSRMISGNHSGFTGPLTCSGSTRQVWANGENGASKNPQPDWAKTRFTDVFGTQYPYKTRANGNPQTLGTVLLDSLAGNDGNANAVSGFASYIIAAYMNASMGIGIVSTVLTASQVVHMWNDVIGSGKYCPQIAMCWNATGVIGYLQNSGIVPA